VTPEALNISRDLRDELAVIDPRTVPARFHNLRAMATSAAHAWHSFQDSGDETLSMRLGSGVHALLLGQPVVVWDQPAVKGDGKAPRNGKAWDAFQRQHGGATILNRTEHDKASRIADAFRANAHAELLLTSPGSVYERTILSTQDGRARRTTPDIAALAFVAEVKTTRSADPRWFRRDCRKLAYHAQVADQCLAIEADSGRRPDEAFIIAVETAPPYVVQVFRLTQRDLVEGEALCRRWMAMLLEAERSNAWGGYSDAVVDVGISLDDREAPHES